MSRRPGVGCVLCGGGITGAMYEIGVLTALQEYLGEEISITDCDVFVGTSAGSVMAVALAIGINPLEIFDAIIHDREHPFNFRVEDIYGLSSLNVLDFFKKVAGSSFAVVKMMMKNPLNFPVGNVLRIIDETVGSGVFTTAKLEGFMRRTLKHLGYADDFSKLRKKLLIPATNLDTGRYEILGEGKWADVPVSTAVAASCAIPVFYRSVRIRNTDFIDGGMAKVAYARQAAEHGARLILIINPLVPVHNDQLNVCFPTTRGPCGRIAELGASKIFSQVMRINNRVKLKLGLQRFQSLNPDIDIMLFQPRPQEAEMFLYNVMSYESRFEIIHTAYCTTAKALLAHPDRYSEIFDHYRLPKPHPHFKRMEILHQMDPIAGERCKSLKLPPEEENFLLPKKEIIEKL